MKFYKIILAVLFLTGCVAPDPSLFNAHSSQFKDKYQAFIGADEQVVASWYHYVSSKDASGKYILRTFFPETKQMTSEVRFKNKQLTIKEGPAKYWHENGNLKSEGEYQNNKAEGEWKYYHRKTGKLSATGRCRADLKEGIWKFFDTKGRLESEITYSGDLKDGQFMEYDSLQNMVNTGIYKLDTVFQQSKIDTTANQSESEVKEQMPHLTQCTSIEGADERNKCTNKAFLEHIYGNLKYPANARQYGIEGMTISQFVIDKDGQVKDIDVVVGICQEFKDECLRVLAGMPSWEPGIQSGEKVKVLYTIPIKFKLE